MSSYTAANLRGGPAPWPLPPSFIPGLAKNAENKKQLSSKSNSQSHTEQDAVLSEKTAEEDSNLEETISRQESGPYEDAIEYFPNTTQDSPNNSSNGASLDLGIDVDSYVDDELDTEVPTTKKLAALFSSDNEDEQDVRNATANSVGGAVNSNLFEEREPFVPEVYDIEISSSNESIHSTPEPPPKPKTIPKPLKKPLRRPIASRRKNLIGLDIVNKKSPKPETKTEEEKCIVEMTTTPDENIQKIDDLPSEAQIAAEKGIIMRPHIPRMRLTGMRRAETGIIVSKEDLKSTRNRDLLANPAPKSFRPFIGEDEDLSTAGPSAFRNTFNPVGGSPNAGNISSRQNSPIGFSFSTIQGVRSQPIYGYSEEENTYTKFSNPKGNIGLVGRLTTKLHRAGTLLGRRSFTAVPETTATDIMIPGTIDEAVCRICVICRNNMEYRVLVRDSGRKIKVESIEGSDNEFLRASLRVKELPGSELVCSINVRQCKSDQHKTGFAAMWRFYQRLERELRPLPRPHENIFSGSTPR